MRNLKRIKLKGRTKDRISQLRVVARKLYDQVPLRFRWIASPLTYCDRLLFDLRPKLWILSGNERISNMPVSILYAVNDLNADRIRNKNYMLGLIFGDSFKERYIGRAWLWKISKVAVKAGENSSFMIVQLHESYRKFLRSSKWFFIPNWVRGEVEIPVAPNVLKKETLRSDLRKIQKHSLRIEVTREPNKFDDFYHNMYVPHVTMAHGSSAYIMPYEQNKTEFQNCELLLVKEQEKTIAGIVIAYEKGASRIGSLGVRDGNLEFVKEGAVTALFYFSLLYLEKKGFTTVNFGLSRAFLRDGVLQYKRKWSQKIAGTSRDWFALKILSNQGAAGVFLQKNIFIFEKHGLLHGAVFVKGDDPLSSKEIKHIEKQHFYPGLSKLFIYYLHHKDALIQKSVPPELSERIVLRSL